MTRNNNRRKLTLEFRLTEGQAKRLYQLVRCDGELTRKTDRELYAKFLADFQWQLPDDAESSD